MRILLLAQFFPPDIGGEERHVFNLANTLAERGHGLRWRRNAWLMSRIRRPLHRGFGCTGSPRRRCASRVSIRPAAPITHRSRIRWVSASWRASLGRNGRMLFTHTTGSSTALLRCAAHRRRDRASDLC